MTKKRVTRKAPKNNKNIINQKGLFITQHYFLCLVVFLIAMFLILFLNDKKISTEVMQVSFIGALIPLVVYAAYLSSKGRFNLSTLPPFIIVVGVFLRVVYTVYSPFTIRQHDVIGSSYNHLHYIRQLAEGSLPGVDYCQAYHPPVHHALSSVFYNMGKAFGLNDFYSFRLVQLFMVFLSCMTLILVYKIFKQVRCNDTVTLAGISIFAFYPYNIYFSAFLNNDNTLMFFLTLTFYCLLRWLYNMNTKNIVILALCFSLSMLTKKPAIVLIPTIFAAFAVILYKNRRSYKPYLNQFLIFLGVAAPLSSLFQIRNYIKFNQGFFYSPGVGFENYANTLYNLFYIPISGFFTSPFTVDPYSQDSGYNKFFSDYALKSSLFGEWRFEGLESIASALLVVTAACLLIMVIYLIIENKNLLKGYGYLFLINLVVPFALLFQSRLSTPVVCAQNFRYAAFMLISVAYFYGKAVDKFSGTRFKFLKYVFVVSTIAFCLCSMLFILQIGQAPEGSFQYQLEPMP
jgi:hypothetical protein